MGYNTDFEGEFTLSKTLDENHRAYLKAFANTRRMMRDNQMLSGFEDPIRESVGLPLGNDGGYYVASTGFRGQDRDDSIINYNRPPTSQPGLWCHWLPNDEGTAIIWDGGSSFYDYVEWIDYIITHFVSTWGYTLNGEIYWYGDDREDTGIIQIKDNVINIKRGKIEYE